MSEPFAAFPALRRLLVDRVAVRDDELRRDLARLIPDESPAEVLALMARMHMIRVDEDVRTPRLAYVMPADPWVAVEATIRRSKKMTALPSDSARWGFIVALGECKMLYQAGGMTPGQWAEQMGRFARFLKDYIAAGLIHLAPFDCVDGRCMSGRGPFPDGWVVIHDWPVYQREHAVRQRRYRDGQSDVPSDAQSDAQSDVPSDALSRGGTRAVSVPVYSRIPREDQPYQVGNGVDPETGEILDEPDTTIRVWLAATHHIAIRDGGGLHERIIGWFRQGATAVTVKAAIDQAVADGAGSDRAVVFRADEILFPLVQPERLSPAERKLRERAEVVARLRAPGGQGHC